MEHVHKQTISFRGDRTMRNKEVLVGYEGDNLVERLEFVLPELVGGQVAKLMITGADAITLNRIDDGRYAADLTREMIGPDGKRDAYVRIDGVSGQIWQSAPLRIVTGKLPNVEGEIEKVYPTAVGQMLTAMAEHTGEMEAQEERVERAAQRAEEAAERAETGGGSGGPGEDGGYYQPSVTDGVLTWTPSKGDMPSVPESDIRGPKGQPGKDGKSAYRYAQDGGYAGTETDFAEKLAQEIPEAYTLPVATADTLGGVRVGGGFEPTNDGILHALYSKPELINSFVVSEDVDSLKIDRDLNGKPFELTYAICCIACGGNVANGTVATGSMIFASEPGNYFARAYAVNWSYPGYKVSDAFTRVSSFRAECDIRDGIVRIRGVHGDEGSASDDSMFIQDNQLKYYPDTCIVEVATGFLVPKNAEVTLYGVRKVNTDA